MSILENKDLLSCTPVVDGLLSGCAPAVIQSISSVAELRSFRAGATIFAQGDPVLGVYCHCTGEVSVQLGEGEHRHEVDRVRPGMLIGFREPERYEAYIVSAIAVTDAELFFIPLDTFMAALHSDINLMLNVMRTLSARIDGLEERLLV